MSLQRKKKQFLKMFILSMLISHGKNWNLKRANYNWETIEESNQFKRWKKEGKQVVLRFLLDYPGKSSHKDIPDWLGNEISDLGDAYNTSYW